MVPHFKDVGYNGIAGGSEKGIMGSIMCNMALQLSRSELFSQEETTYRGIPLRGILNKFVSDMEVSSWRLFGGDSLKAKSQVSSKLVGARFKTQNKLNSCIMSSRYVQLLMNVMLQIQKVYIVSRKTGKN